MKFFLLLCLLALGSASEQRLPLPVEIQKAYPFLVTEPLSSSRIVGGVAASNGEHPHQIALFYRGSFSCGGSLIGPRTVLTAAHCVYGNEDKPTYFTIRYGNVNRDKGTLAQVSQVTRHPGYSPYTIDYDVAVLTLAQPFKESANAKTIPLATTEPSAGQILTVTGFGRLSGGGSLPTTLQKAVNLKSISRSDCQNKWGSTNSITTRMICAHDSKQSACNGDSGGPIILNGNLVGVVSWGSSTCLHQTYPNVYANVANLRDWIESNRA